MSGPRMRTIRNRLATHARGPLIMQVLALAVLLLVGAVFVATYPSGLPPWRFRLVMAALACLVALNLFFIGSGLAGRPRAAALLDWPFLVLSAVLVLATVWMSGQPPVVYLLSIVCGQATFRRGVWPAGVAFGAASLAAWLGLQVVMGSPFYSVVGTEAALAAGILFVLFLTNLLNRYSLQTRRAENLVEELKAAGRELEAAHRIERELAVAEERLRLARDLHDSVTQQLYSVMLFAEAAADQIAAGEPQTAAGNLRDLRDTAQQALREMRMLVFDLHPPELAEQGLARALQTRLDAVEARAGLRAELTVDGTGELAPEVERQVYEIAQEALNNVLRHARAQSVGVQLRFEDNGAEVTIRDDGAGFRSNEPGKGGGLGIPGMKERAARIGGTLRIESEPGRGTTVSVRVPRVCLPRPEPGRTE
jgi:signal transduction histidine kinase